MHHVLPIPARVPARSTEFSCRDLVRLAFSPRTCKQFLSIWRMASTETAGL
jgi:hypothetical protein